MLFVVLNVIPALAFDVDAWMFIWDGCGGADGDGGFACISCVGRFVDDVCPSICWYVVRRHHMFDTRQSTIHYNHNTLNYPKN